MASEFPTNDLQNAWQNQPTEVFKMSAEKLRRKSQELDRRARVAVLVTAAIAILLFLWFGWGFLSFPEKFQKFGLGPFGSRSVRLGFSVLSLWGLYHGYRTYEVFWPSLASSDADLKTTLQSYRQQLEKRRDYTKEIWLKSGLILCFLGIAMVVMPVLVRDIITPLRMLADLGPIFALLILWLAIFIPQRRRRQRKLQQEIDQLRVFESEYQV
jgi:polyferredoxin